MEKVSAALSQHRFLLPGRALFSDPVVHGGSERVQPLYAHPGKLDREHGRAPAHVWGIRYFSEPNSRAPAVEFNVFIPVCPEVRPGLPETFNGLLDAILNITCSTCSNFSDVFDEDHFITSLANDVKVIKKLPKELANATRAIKHFRSWSGIDYYQNEIASLWEDYQLIRAAKSDSRLANNNLPPDIQKLRCRACYEALRFSPPIEAMGKLLVDRMRSYGPYIALHLRYEKDMLAFSGCTHDLSPEEADELKIIRENTAYWKVKDINSTEQRAKGFCPLTPKEVGIFLTAMGFPSKTPIYIAAGEIYGGDSRMADLRLRYPLLMDKEKLASAEEIEPFVNYASQMAALDYIVSVESDIFIPSYSGNMARAVEGHRRFLGHRKTISPDRKALVHLFDKIERGTLREGKKLSTRVIEIHRRRQGSPRKRKGPISGTKGMDRFRSEEAFYVNPLPDCLCQKETANFNTSVSIR